MVGSKSTFILPIRTIHKRTKTLSALSPPWKAEPHACAHQAEGARQGSVDAR